jgi:hypothetical protein
MGNPFLFADRFSGAVVHLTTGSAQAAFIALLLPPAKQTFCLAINQRLK